MISIGHFSLVTACMISIYGVISGIAGARKQNPSLTISAKNSVLLMGALSTLSLISLGYSFLTHDYRNLYVWQHSSNEMHPAYLIGAIWGGMDGSMLLWAVIMALFSSLVAIKRESVPDRLFAWVLPILSGTTSFFLMVVTFLTNPFRLIPEGINHLNGNGLNPLLQNPSMMIHPPMLYLGFTGFVVPFAFCLAALASGNLNSIWIRLTRRWTLVAWTFLTAGIILGGNWAYIELGWGGFWAWDPVENASFMPWLTGTAFLHSVMVQEHRGMLKVWNIALSVSTYLLTVFGTFLTRSGVVQSVHAFAETDVGWVFLAYMFLMLIFATVLTIYRWKQLAPENVIQSYISRESAFLFNNLALLGILIATFWGTMLPVITEYMTGEKSVVGPPFFNKVTSPLFIFLLFLMAVGPLIAWRRNSLKQIKKVFLVPFVISTLLFILCLWIDSSNPLTALTFAICALVIITIFSDFHRVARNRAELRSSSRISEVGNLFIKRPRKYGAHLVHFGVACAAISITAATTYKIERDITLKRGNPEEVGSYSLTLIGISEATGFGYQAIRTEIEVRDKKTDTLLTRLMPEKRVYAKSSEVTTEVDIRSTIKEDLYIALAGLERPEGSSAKGYEDSSAVLKVFINPLQVWLWVSSVVILFGSMILICEKLLIYGFVSEKSLIETKSDASEGALI
ncbi:MAG TPA: heme lyase CcmF/NrfE family subunit [Oligoflexia bacterium]|nr:heme lyase CcmF/NrfE family subunit [Oligoflexia bacterium]HMP48828.1 heme lyase CcmF/NrfE family subunit [Oligoflexia bacterium]